MSDKLPKLNSLTHQKQVEISMEVTAIASYYPGYAKVYVPFVPIHKITYDWELSTKTNVIVSKGEAKTSSESPEERSLRRSQKTVSDYLACNRFELFGTITFGGENRHDINHVKQQFNTWLKNQRDRNGKFKYVFVPEHHKDGALHFHGVLAGYSGKLRRSRNAKTGNLLYGKRGNPRYDLAEFKLGFTRIEKIGSTTDDHAKVGNYIRKYITKEMVSIFGQKRFWASQGLSKPIYEDNPDWYTGIKPDEVYENDYGKIYTYRDLANKNIPAEVKALMSEEDL